LPRNMRMDEDGDLPSRHGHLKELKDLEHPSHYHEFRRETKLHSRAYSAIMLCSGSSPKSPA
jgi:hypothetical protein